MSTKIKTKRIPSQNLPMDEGDLKALAWKAWLALQKKLANTPVVLMQPCSDAPEFVRWEGDVVARFYNNGDWLVCFWYNEKSKKFIYSDELTETLGQEEFY